ncbi:uncharacterized protein LOC122622629 [Drosophila teissieri]|uniref:uncharacterized protein LOC122622629 n=1 Tax=Drosophila teissieri TaxID=7243 RepID=UPI001CBA0FCD|nr:uncharacterized protein LOC122622629 [Drosophila teissieri]
MSESPHSAPHEEHRLCGLGNHTLRSPYRIVRNPHLLKFGQLINSELRSQPLCLSCYTQLIRLYRLKNSNAKRHLAARALLSRSSSRTTHRSVSSVSITQSSEDQGPTTSAAAAAAAAQRVAPSSSEDSLFSDDDDPSSNLSLNAVNGTRLPNVQPIPKRRQFVHLNKEAMDIYLAGTTGG